MSRSPKRPRDPNQLGKLIIDIATGNQRDSDGSEGKDPAAVERGRLGGLKGGRARAKKLSASERKAAASAAATARWSDR